MTSSDKKKILIIEDEKSVADILTKKIQSSGMGVTSASNGEDGLNMAIQSHPDLIILDLILPKLDGMSVLKSLREDDWGKTVPVVILSNLGTGDEMHRAGELGVSQFLIKTDFRLDDVVTKIQEELQKN